MKLAISYKQILHIAYPIMIGGVTQNVIHVVDTVFLGRLGETPLAAAALAATFYFVLIMLGYGFSIGIQIMIARRTGEGREKEVGRVLDHGMYLTIIFSVILFVLMKYITPPFLDLLIRSSDVLKEAQMFLDYRSFGVFFGLIAFGFNGFFTGIGRTKVIIWSTLGLAIVNVFFDYALIFGNFGFPAMGIGGAALASVIAEIVSVGILLIYLFFNRFQKEFLLFRFPRPELQTFKKLGTISSPIVLQMLVGLGGWFIFFVVIEHIGKIPLAISNIIKSIYMVFGIPTWALASSVNTLVSNIIGQGKEEEVLFGVKKVLRISFFMNLLLVILLLLTARQVLQIYTTNQEIIEGAIPVLYVLSAGILMFSLATVLFHSVTGTGSTKISLLIEVVGVIFYLGYIWIITTIYPDSLIKIWGAEFIYWFVLAILCYLFLNKGSWMKSKV